MSRGFVKEDNQEEAPFVPPRAALPDQLENLVTPCGYKALIEEKHVLKQAFKATEGLSERDQRRTQAVINGQLHRLEARIKSARVIEPDDHSEEVRFGKGVCFRPEDQKKAQCFRIVGVDEADLKKYNVSFTAPIIQSMMGCKKGDSFSFNRRGKDIRFEIVDIQA